LHETPLTVHQDRLPGEGFYDIERVRLQGEGLYQVYELLYLRDRWTLSTEVLQLCGLRGLAALWLDSGSWHAGKARFGTQHSQLRDLDFWILRQYLADLGFESDPNIRKGETKSLAIRYSQGDALMTALRPYVQRDMRHKLQKRSR